MEIGKSGGFSCFQIALHINSSILERQSLVQPAKRVVMIVVRRKNGACDGQ